MMKPLTEDVGVKVKGIPEEGWNGAVEKILADSYKRGGKQKRLQRIENCDGHSCMKNKIGI